MAARAAGRGPLDVPFLLLTLLLTAMGLIMLFSASFPMAIYESGDKVNAAYYLIRQGLFAVVGIVLMLIIGRINYARYRVVGKYVIAVAVILLVLVLIPGVGITRNNATRWLGFGELFTFQPSEIAKVGVILYFASSISKKKERMHTFKYGIAPYALLLLVIAFLMYKEPHLSGMVLILGIGAAMLFAGGIDMIWVGAGIGVGVLGVWGYLSGKISYNSARITVWRDPLTEDPELMQGAAYQIRQSLLAIGSGGLLGVGLGRSRQKFLYLPERHNDFIFAIICEELGMVGALLIMAIFALLILRGYWIALHARDRFGALLAVGVTTQVALQVFLNIAVVTNLFPNTGISLPFFSYGGTALVIQLAEMGLVLSVSRQMPPA
ncbi:MAG: putative lipid II flippase FtsW [Oscillospiraceae bacterium]|nr:putative lipid II flippase FtsW [Oscillospiraceae bacterium]